MNNNEIKAFGQTLMATLEPGDTDQNGNQYADIEAYNVEMDKQSDKAAVNLQKFDKDMPF